MDIHEAYLLFCNQLHNFETLVIKNFMPNMYTCKNNGDFFKPVQEIYHPAGTSVKSVKCNKPINSASHYKQWGHFFWHVITQILWKIHEYHSHL